MGPSVSLTCTSAPLFPKFVTECAATYYELRKRGTSHDPGRRPRRRCDWKLGGPQRAAVGASLSPTDTSRPSDRLVAAAAAVLVVGGACRRRERRLGR